MKKTVPELMVWLGEVDKWLSNISPAVADIAKQAMSLLGQQAETLDKARAVRRLQVEYFKTRDKGILAESKAAERELDAALKALEVNNG